MLWEQVRCRQGMDKVLSRRINTQCGAHTHAELVKGAGHG